MQRIVRTVLFIGFGFCGALLFCVQISGPSPLLAQTVPPAPTAQAQLAEPPLPEVSQPSSDLACRGCHAEKTDVLTFASGESVVLDVDLAALDMSAHSSVNTRPVVCADCHQNETGYRYPHIDNPAQTRKDFTGAVAQNCQDCHYSHTPFHDTQQSDYTPPTCVDCHGSHTIDRAENIQNSMPANCLACHVDRSTEWALTYVGPRPGFGAGAEGYVGSARCRGCHDDKYVTWRNTLHARLVQSPSSNYAASVGDFNRIDPKRSFELRDVTYTLGSRWKQLYLTQTVSDTFNILPAQWNVAQHTWEAYHPDDWQQRDWRQECGSCHMTGLDTQTWTVREFGVGCESCHGPGAAHAADPQNVKPYAQVDDQVCGACHSRGSSPEGYPFPATYHPGDTLTDHFTFTNTAEAIWPDGSAKLNNQQYMDWSLGSEKATSGEVNCTTCHAVHDAGKATGQLKEPLNNLCLECHNDQRALVKHTPYHGEAIKKREFSCADCHMPLTATSAVPYDIHNHSFFQPDPQASIDHGGVANMPNACNQCHDDHGETPQWAQQTIDFARTAYKPSTISFYGPGPTPTSPPPPTPMASVGQPVIQESGVDTVLWIRTGLVVGGALVVVLVAAWAFYRIRTRRSENA